MPFRFTLRQLEYFVAVGKTGSIAAASERLNVSSPTISASIAQLETEFGLTLFIREHAKGLTLTKGGERFLQRTEVILKDAENLSDLAGEITGNIQGTLSVGCLVTFAQIVLPSLRRKFEDAQPNARIEQHELNQAEIFSQLRRGELDIALTYDLDIPPELEFSPLVSLPPYVVVSEDHPLAKFEEITVDALRGEPMVLLDLPHSSEYFLSFFHDSGFKPNVTERTRDMSIMRSLVANGFGFSIANILPLNNQSPDGKVLRFIPLPGTARPMQIGLLRVRNEIPTKTMTAFIDHCREVIDHDKDAVEKIPGLTG
ncbi:LysR substrate-binding domain-containing protein [Alisedimentitalea sp. MJ-SS2]|uniref:LysR substrate-binding domain-containing protein n=1 Tax=Aliisedimentitalea sp. MJ-SS2 TaxID=3049795 RepID=UPI002913DACB|nr:LysR substrate-binding domain-containing protein [Alisedimentitalea sp. MJ-SS2]MDU8929910.1 LysR substrate-binding domain-containing protein [Alisedimentitalea sp. MJ-SS2]